MGYQENAGHFSLCTGLGTDPEIGAAYQSVPQARPLKLLGFSKVKSWESQQQEGREEKGHKEPEKWTKYMSSGYSRFN